MHRFVFGSNFIVNVPSGDVVAVTLAPLSIMRPKSAGSGPSSAISAAAQPLQSLILRRRTGITRGCSLSDAWCAQVQMLSRRLAQDHRPAEDVPAAGARPCALLRFAHARDQLRRPARHGRDHLQCRHAGRVRNTASTTARSAPRSTLRRSWTSSPSLSTSTRALRTRPAASSLTKKTRTKSGTRTSRRRVSTSCASRSAWSSSPAATARQRRAAPTTHGQRRRVHRRGRV